ncbi:MAG: sigma-70 family RNA polymerase sigma factor [Gemmataceae bacterium]
MPDFTEETARLLDLLRQGDEQAHSRLIAHTCDRLRTLTSKMLKGYPKVYRWEQTDDVLQNALLRLCRALKAFTPDSPRHFYNLAALQIRRELIDLAHHHLGPQGHGAKHHTDGAGKAADDPGGVLETKAESSEPETLREWADFHEQVERLPDEERQLFGLLWYQGLSQEEAAVVLGVSLRTVKRRWQSARLKLADALRDNTTLQEGSDDP